MQKTPDQFVPGDVFEFSPGSVDTLYCVLVLNISSTNGTKKINKFCNKFIDFR
jgi:hypothetical protein